MQTDTLPRLNSATAVPAIREWLQSHHKTWYGRSVPLLNIHAWMDDAEQGQFVIEIPAHYSMSGAPVTLNLRRHVAKATGAA